MIPIVIKKRKLFKVFVIILSLSIIVCGILGYPALFDILDGNTPIYYQEACLGISVSVIYVITLLSMIVFLEKIFKFIDKQVKKIIIIK